MASKLYAKDFQFGIEMAWHQATKIVEEITSALFPWKAEPRQLFYQDKSGNFLPLVKKEAEEGSSHTGTDKKDTVFNWQVPVGTDDDQPLGKASPVNLETYTLRTLHQDFQLLESAVEGTGHKIVSAGTTHNRARHFMSVELAMDAIAVEHREFGNYANIAGSIDGSCALVTTISSICQVCNNTVTANVWLAEERQKELEKDYPMFAGASIRHTKNMEEQIEELRASMEGVIGVKGEFERALNSLNQTPCKVDDARLIYTGFLGLERQAKERAKPLATRSANQVDYLVDLFENGRGNNGKTRLDLVSGLTEFFTEGHKDANKDSGKDPFGRWQSSEFGNYADKKERFTQRIANGEESVQELRDWGQKVIDAKPVAA